MNFPFIKPVNDPRQTQLAYRLKFWPFNDLSEKAKEYITRNSKFALAREEFEINLTENKTHFIDHNRSYFIVWLYNNIPTEEEYGKMNAITIELRHSSLIPERSVAIISGRTIPPEAIERKE